MGKLDRIFEYMSKNKHKNQTQLINEIMNEYDLTLHTARSYYSKWLTYLKKNGLYKDVDIILRPLNIRVTLDEEIAKLSEENIEFTRGVLSKDIENTIEEFWDTVQVKLNIMDIMGIPIKDIYKGLNKHLDKMSKRGYTFKTEGR